METLKIIAFPCYGKDYQIEVINTNSMDQLIEDTIISYTVVESKPEFPGGSTVLSQYIYLTQVSHFKLSCVFSEF